MMVTVCKGICDIAYAKKEVKGRAYYKDGYAWCKVCSVSWKTNGKERRCICCKALLRHKRH